MKPYYSAADRSGKRPPPKHWTRAECAQIALDHLRVARLLLKSIGARKTLVRVRLAISSAKGAKRHAQNEPSRRARSGA